MTAIVPTVGRVVLYRLSEFDVRTILKASGFKPGNDPKVGDVLPAIVVRTFGNTPDAAVNLQVQLDSPGTYWASSRQVGTADGTYHWMAYQQGQAAKTEQLKIELDTRNGVKTTTKTTGYTSPPTT